MKKDYNHNLIVWPDEEPDFTDAQIGDAVICRVNGLGTILDKTPRTIYPVLVRFDHGEDLEDLQASFALSGRLVPEDKHPSLYYWDGEKPVTQRLESDWPIDTLCVVDNTKPRFRYYAGGGKVWGEGATSLTACCSVKPHYIRKATPEEIEQKRVIGNADES